MLTIIGSNISALVLANKLLEEDIEFEFRASGNLGSGWAGIETEYGLLDLGQRYFELEFEGAKELPISDYRKAGSHRDFVHFVKDYIQKNHELSDIRVQTYFRGNIINCPLETVDLSDCFSLLSDSEKKQIHSEILACHEDQALDFESIHSSSADLSSLALRDLLDENHGKTFNRLIIEPFLNKFGVETRNVPAHLRRKIWCPLFYKKTLIEACNNKFSFKSRRAHCSIRGASNSSLVRNLSERLQNSKAYHSVLDSEDYFVNYMQQDMKHKPDKIVFATSIDWIASKVGLNLGKEKAVLRVLWFKCDTLSVRKKIDYLSVIDESVPFYRVSSSSCAIDELSTIFCVETNDTECSPSIVKQCLKNIGLVANEKNLQCINDISAKLEAPTRANCSKHEKMLKNITELAPLVDFGLCGEKFGINTFNDQVLRALLKYEEINDE
jgi:hypothetical protein